MTRNRFTRTEAEQIVQTIADDDPAAIEDILVWHGDAIAIVPMYEDPNDVGLELIQPDADGLYTIYGVDDLRDPAESDPVGTALTVATAIVVIAALAIMAQAAIRGWILA